MDLEQTLTTADGDPILLMSKSLAIAETTAINTNIMPIVPTTAAATIIVGPVATATVAAAASVKTLKRCLSVPIIQTLAGTRTATVSTMTTRSAAAAAAASAQAHAANVVNTCIHVENMQETPKKCHNHLPDNAAGCIGNFGSIHIGIPRSNPSSREVSPAPVFNIFTPRARRYSASYSPLNCAGNGAGGTATNAPLCLTPRVSQLRQEECIDINSRESNHEREVHSAMQISQSWEDLTLVAENWSCKSDDLSNPLQVSCSSPSPTSTRANLRLPYGLSPSPTRRTFATRRSMSPIAMRPSQLGPVKRKFELDDNNSSNWNICSPPPLKKIFSESRGSSPVCQSPSSVCPSPDSGTYDGRTTPKLFISKLCTTNNNNNNNSACSSPISASSSSSAIDSSTTSGLCSSSSSTSSIAGGSEPMCIGNNIDEGISISEGEEKLQCTTASNNSTPQPMSTDMQDDGTLMDDNKSETSSIGGCSSISIESSSCDSGAKAAVTFLNKLMVSDDVTTSSLAGGQKQFFINKQGLSGAKKYIVNHDSLPTTATGSFCEHLGGGSVSSTTDEVIALVDDKTNVAVAKVIVDN